MKQQLCFLHPHNHPTLRGYREMVVNGGLISISMTGFQVIGLVGIVASFATQDPLGLGWTALGIAYPKYPIFLLPLSGTVSLTKGVIRTYNAVL